MTSSAPLQLTSTTAPGATFGSRGELAEHYKSDWHKYNLKRREANMPMLNLEDFTVRYEAAMALRREREGRQERTGKDHLKDKTAAAAGGKKAGRDSGNKKGGGVKISKRQMRQQERSGGVLPKSSTASLKDESAAATALVQPDSDYESESESESDTEMTEQEQQEEEGPPTIDPKQCLFDSHISPTVEANVEYMYKKYGFFIPDREFLVDLEGLIGYCAEKIKLGHMCLYTQRTFKTYRACQQSMIQKRHTKLRYEAGIDLEEFDVFYDFSEEDKEFLASGIGNFKKKKRQTNNNANTANTVDGDNVDGGEIIDEEDDDESGEWEDVPSDEEMEDNDEDDEEEEGVYAAYQNEIANHGFNITPLGELVFPDGRIIGHRGLARYYKQRFTPEDSRTSVMAARRANGERLIEGRVYDTYAMQEQAQGHQHSKEQALQLAKAGITPGAAQGRAGKGILVNAAGGSGASSFTAVSLYRYRAAVNKARKEEFKGRRLQQRTTLPMNKMDKKANRMATNVSMAHALR